MVLKNKVNSTIFDSINTEEKAYWLGFIYADGNLSNKDKIFEKTKKSVYRIEVSLCADDILHLEKLRIFLGIEKPLKLSKASFRKERCRLYFNDKHMWNILNSYGCTPIKSLTLKFPNIKIFKNKNLIKDFIRGYIDGDGCISYCDKDHSEMTLRILGTKHFLENLQKQLPLEKENKLSKKINVYDLSFQRGRGLYICNYLYKNAKVYLDRKYKRYKEYCRLYEES